MREIPTGALWTPGNGMTNVDELAAARAVEEYDSTLRLGHRRDTNEWIVFLNHGTRYNDGAPFPLMTFGERLPSPDEVKKILYTRDVRRHGDKIFKNIMQRNDALNADRRSIASEASGVVAETMASAMAGQGYNPFPQSVRNLHPKGGRTASTNVTSEGNKGGGNASKSNT
jgi:hypothetical protein